MPIDQLTDRLKKEDKSYARLSKIIMIVYLVMVPVYAYLSVNEYLKTKDWDEIFWGASIIVSFVIFILLFKSFYKEYNYVNYAEPTLQMLKKAAYRYKAFNRKSIWAIVAVVIMGVAFVFRLSEKISVVLGTITFLGIIVLAVICGLILWYYKYRPIRVNALALIKDLESEE